MCLTPLNKKEIIEIGPGTGNLTREILKLSPKNLICIEKDKNLLSILNKNFKYYKNFSVSNADILKVNLKNIINKNTIIIGNLPYNISTQIIVKFIRLNWPQNSRNLFSCFRKK